MPPLQLPEKHKLSAFEKNNSMNKEYLEPLRKLIAMNRDQKFSYEQLSGDLLDKCELVLKNVETELDILYDPSHGYEPNVKYLLENCPHTIRVREGGGPESIVESLIVTFTKMQHQLGVRIWGA